MVARTSDLGKIWQRDILMSMVSEMMPQTGHRPLHPVAPTNTLEFE